MKRILITTILTVFSFAGWSQKKDSLDNLVFTVNPEWKASHTESYKQFTFYAKDKSFCQLTIYKSQPSSGNKLTDFQNEWKELIEKNFTVLTLVSPTTMKSSKGFYFQRLGAKATAADGNKYYVQLNVFDAGNSIQSVIAVSGTQKQLLGYDSSWQKMITGVKKLTTKNQTDVVIKATPPVNKTLIGTWHKSSSSPSAYTNGVLTNLGYSGYTKGEYNFNADGTYAFQGESWGGYLNSTEYRLIDESGSYSVSDKQLIITPSRSLYRVVDPSGKLKSSQKIPLTKRTYNWQLHYYEGLDETNLVLNSAKENIVDGGYSSDPNFPQSFLYSPGKKIEFRFAPINEK